MRLFLVIVSVGIACAGAAAASGKCHAPLEQWQPRQALRMKLERAGWSVRSIRSQDGCYLANAVNEKGEAVNVQFDPMSFAPLDTSVVP
ncbi:PepSY domain-containing protein [Rhizobium sp. 18065]|uniref:PepSY domain-containing protein n=1 Tax=Rhizobium sp. 18065 TaxID=2681411 RepID=UPI0013574347|nr:PepSY domain-containing protein [Rhizobium sp. 18065]